MTLRCWIPKNKFSIRPPAPFEVVSTYADYFDRFAWERRTGQILAIYEIQPRPDRRAFKVADIQPLDPKCLPYQVAIDMLRNLRFWFSNEE
jgi:hypothetical protein